jgi:hypothetical protein
MTGWYLSDDALNLSQWAFPAVTIPADGYIVVFATKKNRAVAGSELHTNFKLSSGGSHWGPSLIHTQLKSLTIRMDYLSRLR